MFKRAFTMVELIFVIVIMGILAKFGVQFLMNAYETYFFSTLQNRLQQQSEAAVTQLAARLQYRIKGTVVMSAGGTQLDWIGMDIDGWRGRWDGSRNVPAWSGFIDINTTAGTPDPTFLSTPQTNTATASTIINALSYNVGGPGINNAAIVFTGATDPTATVWDGVGVGGAITQTDELAHPIIAAGTSGLAPSVGNFSGVDVYEFYKLAWTAYTVRLVGDTLTLFYDYQPWGGEDFNSATQSSILMENVQSFQYETVGDLIKIQVCINDDNLTNPNLLANGGFSVCKEKTVF